MNQHNYPLLGSMAGAIFMDDKDLYDEKVEWFTVNETAEDEGFNGSYLAALPLGRHERQDR